ncbi:RDD family protein [Curtobacterium sp. UNCCL20]|uniref:VanZ family protein n=1 Tax=Curtobacterium sp. UNCCL20 TaxID=1502773 RepID=UPI000886E706|nr:VanZ family protein [Curtobacterium sp. UNCCL20]SDQ24827.1 RDD family protein [Curtobacterium sp. UNCCL20]
MGTLLPGIIAFAFGTVLAVAAFVPWLAREYRRYGRIGFRRGLLGFGTVVYALALLSYTLLPLPDDTARMCLTAAGPQTVPFRFLEDIAKEGGITGVRSLLTNPAVAQVVFNVLLFVPLGALVGHRFARRGVGAAIAAGVVSGFLVSLAIECTQLTGDWFLYPCAYRLFDVDDLIANTGGAVLGLAAAPLVTLFVRSDDAARAGVPRPVTAGRRFLGMVSDVLAISLTSGALSVGVTLVAALVSGGDVPDDGGVVDAATAVLFVAPAAQLVIVLVTGRTLGDHVVRIAPVGRPGAGRRLVRWALGSGGWGVATAVTFPLAGLLAAFLAVAGLIGMWTTRGHRGFPSAVAGIDVQDDRVDDGVAAPSEAPTEPVG